VPARLAERDLPLRAETVARAARAQASVERGAEAMPGDDATLARLLLRAEGVASSFIRGRLRSGLTCSRVVSVAGRAGARVASARRDAIHWAEPHEERTLDARTRKRRVEG
jgi:hypothetical protein